MQQEMLQLPLNVTTFFYTTLKPITWMKKNDITHLHTKMSIPLYRKCSLFT